MRSLTSVFYASVSNNKERIRSMSDTPQAKYRLDYQPPAFTIDRVVLDIELDDQRTVVSSRLDVRRLDMNCQQLVLDGENLTLLGIKLNDHVLAEDAYQVLPAALHIRVNEDTFTLDIETEINPAANSALEGLYKSGGAFCTQCEAEGFRRITYYLDRPDVLAVFTTTVRADKSQYPYLLANGNPIDSAQLDNGRHAVTWHDPHPKPCYLFALVAGDFDRLDDNFTTRDGREVALQLFVDKGNLPRSEFAMQSLKASMAWDEQRFNLIYDLDIYMIVAVDFFNMGAMENKGLNIFNSKYVLADAQTATDQDFLNVESVIGHEYFHNWTGNRITCRDWFQLSLKEGLTVFRDQEFSADQSMRPVHRINDIRIMRTHQFAEDASPMAHPIRPDKVIEMNNFYTVTVYNKGAEVIRMIHTLLGEEGFQRGMQLYVERHDGQAVTCEDFVCAMEDANQYDLGQFRRWYEQAGTPRVAVKSHYDDAEQKLYLDFTQQTSATPGQTEKKPFHIPVRLLFYSRDGQPLVIEHEALEEQVYSLTQTSETLCIDGKLNAFSEQPVVAFFAGFSAPVRIEQPYIESERLILLAHSDEPFTAWDSAQQVYLYTLRDAIEHQQPVALSATAVEAIRHQLVRQDADPALTALLLQTPSEEALSGEFEHIDVDQIHRVCAELKLQLATELKSDLWHTWQRTKPTSAYQFEAEAIAQRMLANTCLGYLALVPDAAVEEALHVHFSADNLTDQLAALQAAVHANHPIGEWLLSRFAEQWQGQPLVMDKWFAVQASAPFASTLSDVQELTSHAAFDWSNPNRIYALIATFSHNLSQLHRADGAGYRWLREVIETLNKSNPQVASRLVSALLQWRRLDQDRQQLLKKELETLRQLPELASDLFEKVEQSLT